MVSLANGGATKWLHKSIEVSAIVFYITNRIQNTEGQLKLVGKSLLL